MIDFKKLREKIEKKRAERQQRDEDRESFCAPRRDVETLPLETLVANASSTKSVKVPSRDQQEAIDTVLNNVGPFYLAGPAGTGKSFVINYIKERTPNCVVCATTGIAAQLIGGRTLHSFLGIHPQHGVVDSWKANDRVSQCDLLVIDEISMANDALLEQVYERFDRAGHNPKVLAVGDFLQLPPVDGKFAFESDLWRHFRKLTLTHMHRQNDPVFIDALSDLRVGKYSERVKNLIKERTVDSLPENCTKLFSHRVDVNSLNEEKLKSLPGQIKGAEWEIIYSKYRRSSYGEADKNRDIKQEERVLDRCRFPRILLLKDRARVVMLNNDKDERWVNGSNGEVVDIQPDCVKVLLDNGRKVDVEPIEESVMDENGSEACTIRQFPMQLAFALTIHKAQGMTLDRVGVDLNNHFASGQTYVAMSRCKFMNGLHLTGDFVFIPPDQKALEICG